MAHWAELDENNYVIRVVVTSNNEPDEGYEWLKANLGGRWVQTSYNGRIRRRYAGIGYSYNEQLDVFITPKCHETATFNEVSADWDCPELVHTAREFDGTYD